MKKAAEEYFGYLARAMESIRVTDMEGKGMDFYHGVQEAGTLIKAQTEAGRKLMFIGNGASAAISSHMSTDFWKNGGMRAVAFNDGSLLTCMGNDFGYGHVFEKPIEMFADPGDVLVAVSSSGRSENILLGVSAARGRDCKVVSLSGFEPDNPLSSMGDLNFYVPVKAYGPVEVLHHAVCHCILDVIMKVKISNG
jgi:D-sedoheptulose 7-phosphate isomerase